MNSSVSSGENISRAMRNTALNMSSSSNGQTSKRLVIKNLKGTFSIVSFDIFNFCLKFCLVIIETPKSIEDVFSRLWPCLDAAVRAIHSSKPISTSLEILYQNVENLCFEKKSSALYLSLKQLCEEHIKGEVPKLTLAFDDQIDYLKLLNRHWQDHCAQMLMICQIFLPLDRGYVLNNPLILSIWDLSLELFKNYIVTNKTVQIRCINGILALIERERNGELIDRSLVKNLLNMLYKLQVIFFIFIRVYIRRFYRNSKLS